MRQRQFAQRESRLPPGRRPAGLVRGTSALVDLPGEPELPRLEKIRAVDGTWYRPRPQSEARIVDEWLDGSRYYPEPPHRSRAVNRLDRLLKRARPSLLFFLVVALTQTGTLLFDFVRPAAGSETPQDLAYRLLMTCSLTLLPAGVLVWRSDAWRSARLVLVGAIAWATLPALVGLVWWLIRRSPFLMDRIGYEWSVVVGATGVAAFFGPMVMAYGLERLRLRQTAELGYVAWRLVAMAGVSTLFNTSRWFAPGAPPYDQPVGGGTDPLHLGPSIAGSALPFEFVSLLLLAYVCVAAVRDDESQRRLWQCGAVAAGLLSAASFYELSVGMLLPNQTPTALAGMDSYGGLALLCLVGGYVILLLAFGSPIWSAARDATGERRTPPDAVFAWGVTAEPGNGQPIPMANVVAVAAGTDHALALDDRGFVAAWGDDTLGQTQVPDGLSGVTAIAAGDGFSLALKGDGTVVAWGANDLGQTGVPDDLSAVIAIAAGRGFALALKSDGTVAGWGDGESGAAMVPAGLTGVVAISAGQFHALGLRSNGQVVAWGDNRFGQASVPVRAIHATGVAAGGDFSLALLSTGTVVAWGDNSYGQLDVPPDLTQVTAIAAGAFHGLALRAGGDLIGWGGGGQRQGEAWHPWRLVDFKAVAAGDGFSLAIRAA